MPGPNPLSNKNSVTSPALSDLGLGDQLVQGMQDMLDQRKKKLLNADGNQIQGGFGFSPAVQSLGIGAGYGG